MKHPCTYFPSVAGRAYAVIAIVERPKAAPHAGADSPRYLEAGKRGSVKVLRVFRPPAHRAVFVTVGPFDFAEGRQPFLCCHKSVSLKNGFFPFHTDICLNPHFRHVRRDG